MEQNAMGTTRKRQSPAGAHPKRSLKKRSDGGSDVAPTPVSGKRKALSSPPFRAGAAAKQNSSLGAQSPSAEQAKLPINAVRDSLIPLLSQSSCTVLVGETGSGKTTQIPQMLLRAGLASDKCIVVTQPRRVAAVTVAARVAQEMGVPLGDLVGYSVRFDDVTSPQTRIKYMTDGLLLREALLDPLLSRYSVIIVDEAHERTVHTDALLGLLKGLREQRRGGADLSPGGTEEQNGGSASALWAAVHGPRRSAVQGKMEKGNGKIKETARWGRMQASHRQGKELKAPTDDVKGFTAIPEAVSPAKGSGGAEAGEGHRGEVKLVIMSATLESDKFLRFFPGATAVHVAGRPHAVEVLYAHAPEADYLDASLVAIMQIHLDNWEREMEEHQHMEQGQNGEAHGLPPRTEAPLEANPTLSSPARARAPAPPPPPSAQSLGGVLVFLPGQDDIETLAGLLKDKAASLPRGTPPLAVAPIFAALPTEQQMRVFRPPPPGTRKVVLATNIAETSVTIPGVRYVVDPGLVKARVFDPRVGADALLLLPVSKAQARQRSGRAGRKGPGQCFRLYTEETFESLPDSTMPEILRADCAGLTLQLKALGVNNLRGFPLLDPPPRAALVRALELLYTLGALTVEGALSSSGASMARLPLDPLYAKAVLEAAHPQWGAVQEVLLLVSMLSVDAPFFTSQPRHWRAQGQGQAQGKADAAAAAQQRFHHPLGDHLTLINIGRQFIAEAYRGLPTGAQGGSGGKDGTETHAPETGEGNERKGGSGEAKPSARALGSIPEGPLGPLIACLVEGPGGHGRGQPQEDKSAVDSLARSKRMAKWCHRNHLNLRSLQRTLHICRQLLVHCRSLGFPFSSCATAMAEDPSATHLRRCLAAAFFLKVAKRLPNGTFRTVQSNQTVAVHPSSVLMSSLRATGSLSSKSKKAAGPVAASGAGAGIDCFLYDQLLSTNKLYAKTLCAIDQSWLTTHEPLNRA